MSYQVLARKWRPRDFATLVGQEHVVKALRHALEQQRLHHAYLFTGTRGVGKTTLARILAKCLNCQSGITATPCGQCTACVEIDGGRFIDYIEMDAASNRGVDEMTQLLERAVYAPTSGRFKVYVIDEVHQLSGHAFNAMLKTLEEPPEHLKFILATTDPQKVPVTVLSRCLQFNLKQMPPPAIVAHLGRVLEAEGVACEPEALPLLARAAAGSMRDALSLLDQAIAHGAGRIGADHVRAMLGAIDETYLLRLLETLARGEVRVALEIADEMQARSLSFDAALQDLASLLLRVALYQAVPDALDADFPERGRIAALAQSLDAEAVQLYYQIALQGREDLPLAPDEHAGFAMTLLRLFAFRPEAAGRETMGLMAKPSGARTPVGSASALPIAPAAGGAAGGSADFAGDWATLVGQLAISGVAKELARHAELARVDGALFELVVPKSMPHLVERNYCDKLKAALEQHFHKAVQLRVVAGEAGGNSVAALEASARDARRAEASRAVKSDRFVQELVTLFDGRVMEPEARPAPKNG
ncbi:MAG: DNA polymerase III subunit gamma/tau [Betaproteobacteria bacterium]|nr:MAG: DNA polymerase III subunit gamma/tau [Betaproteobacteria bacterium]